MREADAAEGDLLTESNPPHALVAAVEAGLYAYNESATGRRDGESFGISARAADGTLKGGLHGWVWAGAASVLGLWVASAWRGKGLGSRLLAAAEAHARRHGSSQMLLTTYSFQARGFYERQGYAMVAEVENHPPGHSLYTMRKWLDRPGKEPA